MNALATAPVIGRDPYPLPAIYLDLSPELRILHDRYEAAFKGMHVTAPDEWGAVVKEIASFTPENVADHAGKLMLGLHFLEPGLIDGVMAIDTSSFSINGAAEILLGCLLDLTGDWHSEARQRWAAAWGRYEAARSVQGAFDDLHFKPHVPDNLPRGPELSAAISAVPSHIWDESERLVDVISAAEDALMEVPSPDATAFARKFLIAHADGRRVDGWTNLLGQEARRFAGVAAA